MDNGELRKHLQNRKSELESELNSFIGHYRDITDYLSPRAAKFLVDPTDARWKKGQKQNTMIVNETASMALEILKSGMHAGMTSPARPWFRFTTSDPGLMEYESVKQWLFDVEERMRLIFAKSNIYNAFPIMYGSLGGYGTAAMYIEEDPDTVIRAYTFPIGSYLLALNERLQVDTIYRKCPLSIKQIVQKFASRKAKSGSEDWSNISSIVKTAWDRGNYGTIIEVFHSIEPNLDAEPGKLSSDNKPFRSIYWEPAADGDKVLRQSGYDEFPCMCPRWDVFSDDDVYGYSPGMLALGSVKQLQLMERRDDEAIEKKVRPPMLADSSLRNERTSIVTGDVTYIDNLAVMQHAGFRPVYEVEPKTMELNAKIQRIEGRIRQIFHTDLMLMFAQSDDPTMTAREVEERHQEKLLVLGPVLERQNPELYNPAINRTFSLMLRRGLIPLPPPEIEGQDLKIEYTSMMAQAQKLISTASIVQFTGYVGNLAAATGDVSVWDKVDTDQSIDEMANMHGVPPRIVRSDDSVKVIRDNRQKAQAAQQMAALAQPAAQAATAAKTLSETDVAQTSALTRLLGM